MKIAILSRHQKTISRGAESFVTELAHQLSKNNTVKILSGKDADSFGKIITGKYDVVVAINGRMQSLKASFGRLFSNYQLIIPGESGIGRDDIWNIVVGPDAYVALTDKMFHWAKKWAWRTKVIKIPNGVDLQKFSAKGEKFLLKIASPLVLSVGALTWYKHHEYTINALENLPEISLCIVGKGEEEAALIKLAEQKIPGRFQIFNTEYKNLPSIYRAGDLFVLPSWDREAFGIVYLEALASNRPVVAPNDSTRQEIIGDAGILVEVSDPKAYAQAVKQALSRDWKDLPQQQAEKFSWERVGKQYQKLMEALCQRSQ